MPISADPVVIVGAGLAGLGVAEELRRRGHTAPLVLVGEELELPYDRPPLSKQVLRGERTEPAHLRAPEQYAELEVELRLGTRAVGLDPSARRLALEDGTTLARSTLAYGAVVLATGASPRLLPGPQLPGMHALRTYADALALRSAMLAAGRLTVVGGGFIGCEAAASARALDLEVDLVELLSGPLVRVLGPAVATRIAQLHLDHGVRLHCGVGVTAVRGDGRVQQVELADGTLLPSTVVLVGLGVLPATSWLADSGLDLTADGAVLCDTYGRTCTPHVWAVGDASAWQDASGRHQRVEHWTSAVEQAAVVAANLHTTSLLAANPDEAADLVPHAGVPYFWSDQYSTTLQAVGNVRPDTEVELLAVGEGVVALHAEADRLSGVVCVDARKQSVRARKLLRAGSDLEHARTALLR